MENLLFSTREGQRPCKNSYLHVDHRISYYAAVRAVCLVALVLDRKSFYSGALKMHSNHKRSRKTTNESSIVKKARPNEPSYAFLETINRKKLDFDFEKVCSVSLSNLNVYCCLVCGKYLQGRRPNSPAFLHSVSENHHVYLNFDTLQFYLLPDGTLVDDNGKIQLLNSIRYAIRPIFTEDQISQFPKECFDLNNRRYRNGFVGITNSSRNKGINPVLLAIAHIRPIRDFLLLSKIEQEDESIKRLAIIVRKLWSTKLFKQHVSVDEFLAYVSVIRNNVVNSMQDPRKWLLWIFDSIMKKSIGLRDIIHENCQGKVIVTKIPIKSIYDEAQNVKGFVRELSEQKENIVPFWNLTLDLPPRPLFKAGLQANDLPQVRLEDLMTKFDGLKEKEMSHHVMKYQVTIHPKYLILHFDRFDKNDQFPVKNRNQTLVEFPLSMKIGRSKYALIANIIHDTARHVSTTTQMEKDQQSNWKIQLYDSKNNHWMEIDGATVRKLNEELLFLNETYIQVWEMRSS